MQNKELISACYEKKVYTVFVNKIGENTKSCLHWFNLLQVEATVIHAVCSSVQRMVPITESK